MSVDNTSDKPKAAGADPAEAEKDAEARKAAADSLRRQIANLKAGGRKPRSLNEFIEEKMAEDRRKQMEKEKAGR